MAAALAAGGFALASVRSQAPFGMRVVSALVVGACAYALLVVVPVGATPPFRPGAVLHGRRLLAQGLLMGGAFGAFAAPLAIEGDPSEPAPMVVLVVAVALVAGVLAVLLGLVLLLPPRPRRFLLTHSRHGSVVRICPSCDQHVSSGAEHCGRCGRLLDA